MVMRIGGFAVRIEGPEVVQRAVAARFGAFLADTAPAAVLRVEAAPSFDEGFHLDEPSATIALAPAGDEARFARGGYSLARSEGWLEGARHLGEVDALVRLALSLELPRCGALLLHAAAIEAPGGAAVLLGPPGAGKSTAAAGLGALSDELTVIHVARSEAEGTPYWHGIARRAPIAALQVLERGSPARERLTGAAALRAIAPHLVRYLLVPATERTILPLAAALCERVPVERLRCPEGAAYLPFLRGALGMAEHAA